MASGAMRSGLGSRTATRLIGAARMAAPLPAEFTAAPERCHGTPSVSAWTAMVVALPLPRPMGSHSTRRRLKSTGSTPPRAAMSDSATTMVSWVSSVMVPFGPPVQPRRGR